MRFLILPLLLFVILTAQAQTTDLSHQTPYLLENKGQLSNSDGTPADQVLYYMNTPKLDFFVTTKGITYVFKQVKIEQDTNRIPGDLSIPDEKSTVFWHRVDVNLSGGNISKENIEIIEATNAGTVSIFNQLVPQGLEKMQPIGCVTFKNVYPGIDWQFVVNNDNLKYNFILHKGADISQIKLVFEGQDNISLENNKLTISTSLGSLAENNIESFLSTGKSIDVKPLLENNSLSYSVAEMPELVDNETLIIDPPLVWATYYGGSSNDKAIVMERNLNGFIYILIETLSSDFPLLNPAGLTYYQGVAAGNEDAGVVKFTEDGALVWSTFYGGAGIEKPYNLFYDGDVLVIVGRTTSNAFPTYNPGSCYYDNTLEGSQDGFILAFGPFDVRLWATLFGGNDEDEIFDCTYKNSRLLVTGHSKSTLNFPLMPNGTAYYKSTNGYYDAFVAEFNISLTLLPLPSINVTQSWCTFVGGSDIEKFPYCDIDSIGRFTLTYQTLSSDITLQNIMPGSYSQTYAGGVDMGITMFDANRQIIWQTYMGGPADDWANEVICNNKNEWFFTGVTKSSTFPISNSIGAGFYQSTYNSPSDATIIKFDSAGALLYSSFYGGSGHNTGFGLNIDSHQNLYVIGSTAGNMFTYNPNDGSYIDSTFNGTYDGFLIEFDSSFNPKWATVIGGSGDDPLYDVRVSPSDHIFVVGYTQSANQPLLDMGSGAYFDNTLGGARDAIIMKFIPCPENFDTIHFTDSVCYGEQTLLYATGSNTYTWNLGSTNDSITATIVSDTTFSIIATYLTCIERDTVHIAVKPLPVIDITGDSVVCFNDTVHLIASGGVDYQWENGLTGATIAYIPTINDTLSLTVINSYNCSAIDSIAITVHPLPIPTISGDTTVCMNDTLLLEADGGTGFLWSNTTTDSTIAISQNTSGFFDYYVVVTDTNMCSDTAFQTIEIFPLPVFFLGNDTTLCQGNSLLLQVGFTNANYLWSTSETTSNITVNTPNDYSLLVTDSNSCHYADTINVAVIPYADATIDSIPYVCENNPAFLFTAAETGGIWSGTGITNTSTGAFDPTIAGVGFFSVYYTIGGFCGDSDSTIIEIAEVPSFSFATTDETCAGANDGTLIISASGGAAPYTFILDTLLIGDTATNLSPFAYNLFVIDNRGCVETDSVFIVAEDFPCGEVNFYIPNIFSPNGDGVNDILYVRSDFIDNMKFLVYDRFGEKVFESTNPDIGWDGKYNGQPVAPGVYHYFINVNLIDGSNVERKGNVTIVR